MEFQRQLILLTILTFIFSSHSSCINENVSVMDQKYMDSIQKARKIIKTYLNETENQNIPGLVIGVSVGGQPKWVEGFGLANIENVVQMKSDTVMTIGSITKSFTVALAAQLVQQGKLDLDVSIMNYLTGDEYPLKMWNESAVNITMRQLLQHTAGIANGPIEKELGKCLRCTKQKDRLILMKDKKLDFEPGTQWSYSNFGYELAGAVVESVLEGKLFYDAMTEMIKNSLGLNHTAIVNSLLITPNLASFYMTDQITVFNSGMWGDVYLNDLHASGGIMATLSDLLEYGQKWCNAFNGKSEEFLKQEMVKDIWTPSDVSGGIYGMGWGITIINKPRGHRMIWHNGGTLGSKSMLTIYPDTDIIVAASANLAQSDIDVFIAEGTIADLFALN